MRRLVPTLFALVALAVPVASHASAFSTMDGSGLGEGTRAVQTWVGVPTLGVRYMQGRPGDFDFGYGLTIDYLKGSAEPDFHIRWSFAQGDDYNLALITDFGLFIDTGLTYAEPNNTGTLGLRINPGLAIGMRPHPNYTTFFTVEVPFLWTWGYGGGYALPALMGLGVEYAMTPDVNVVAYGRVGARIEGGGGFVGGLYFVGDAWAGLEFRLF